MKLIECLNKLLRIIDYECQISWQFLWMNKLSTSARILVGNFKGQPKLSSISLKQGLKVWTYCSASSKGTKSIQLWKPKVIFVTNLWYKLLMYMYRIQYHYKCAVQNKSKGRNSKYMFQCSFPAARMYNISVHTSIFSCYN